MLVSNQNKKGFSLLELMIALLIISICAAYSYPSYKRYITNLRRIDGKTALLDLANRLENYYAISNSYQKATIGTGSENDVLTSQYSADGWYTLSILKATKSTFLIQATPRKSQAIDDLICRSYTLNNQGEKLVDGEQNLLKLCW